jgi:medium-chain acyl-[acyl-carrier-protein] hydrolase
MQTREMREESFTVASFDSDFTGRLALSSLFERFQDIAGLHATHLNVGFDELRESGVAWMLSRIKLNIERLPKWGETVTLRTWPKGVDRLFALRDFRLTSDSGSILALATTCWLLVDLEKGRPRRIESLNVDLQFPGAEQAINEIPDKITAPQSLVQAYERSILASELDVNEHVNNAHYVRWVMDCFDAAQLRARTVRSLQINYLDQARYGDRIGILVSKESDAPSAQYFEGVSKKNGEKVFQALVEWG